MTAIPPRPDAGPAPSPWDGRRARIEPVWAGAAGEPPAAGAPSDRQAPPSKGAPAGGDRGLPRRPTLRFALARPAHLIALGFGSGLPRLAPGTWGTFAAWLIFVALDPRLTDTAWLGVIVAALVIGAWAAQRTSDALGAADSGHIVIDEMAAFWIVLVMLPDGGAHPGWLQAVAFGLFRLFDIAKPPPIRWIDTRIHNGIGVMLDDVVAALYTLLVVAVAWRLV